MSRYYNPQWGRFHNADLPEIAQQSKNEINGLNLFAYCCNNPVNNSDPSGYFALTMTATYCGIAVIVLCSFAIFYITMVPKDSWSGANLQKWTTKRIPLAKHIPLVVFSAIILLAKSSKLSKKARATDIPSWARKEPPNDDDKNDSERYTKRILDKKYGKGKWKKGPNTEYNKIKKFAQRSLGMK